MNLIYFLGGGGAHRLIFLCSRADGNITSYKMNVYLKSVLLFHIPTVRKVINYLHVATKERRDNFLYNLDFAN